MKKNLIFSGQNGKKHHFPLFLKHFKAETRKKRDTSLLVFDIHDLENTQTHLNKDDKKYPV